MDKHNKFDCRIIHPSLKENENILIKWSIDRHDLRICSMRQKCQRKIVFHIAAWIFKYDGQFLQLDCWVLLMILPCLLWSELSASGDEPHCAWQSSMSTFLKLALSNIHRNQSKYVKNINTVVQYMSIYFLIFSLVNMFPVFEHMPF